MKIFKINLAIICLFLIFSCEEVIDVDLDTAEPQLVIDASIDWVKNTQGNNQKIVLSTTTGYYSTSFPSVSGAVITVNNSTNTQFEFVESSVSGEYICQNFIPEIGETYTLNIQLNGETYSATETLIEVPDLEDLIEQNNTGGMGGDELEITYYYTDDAQQQNYYLYKVLDPRIAFPMYSVENDENSNGNRTPVYYSNKDLEVGDQLNISLYGISGQYYSYFRRLLNASGNDSNPFATIPAAVRGNIINETNSQNYAYGYFRLSQLVNKQYIIQ